MKNEVQLIESKELREQMIDKIEVLEKVKSLLLIPQTELATVKQVAEYYEVTTKVIEQIYLTHKDELVSDGMCNKSYKEFLNLDNLGIEKFVGKSILTLANGEKLEIPNRGLKVFTKRSLLRIGMLLRDSPIAKEIRTRLLDIVQDVEDKAPEIIQQVTTEIEMEKQLLANIGLAYDKSKEELMQATKALENFRLDLKEKRISQLENDNKALTNGILEWEDKSKLNKGIRVLAGKVGIRIGDLWLELYNQILYKYHINLKARNNGKKPYINNIKEYEWEHVIKCFSALCKYYGYSPTELINQLEVE